ncbi:protein FAR1-RELATED SEQUENCE 5-like [Arachis hypogaea]|uniref:protein FAR1-RELATED SEQUENCE 5-like n=1 Tax=Arachis hypogaea TaxID=3818 RepID=UPI000DED0361|nr:protein FAR1-RELATED SEQUENCE 5-like [Arachis hypogaea]
MHAKCMIENNDEDGIQPNKTFLALANEYGGPSNLGYSEKDLRNYITARLRTSNVNVDVREMINYFMRMKDINPNFFYAVNLDDECKFRRVVWVDARYRASYEYYGDVVSLDSTYSTNKHGLLFASFVGVNHHGYRWYKELYDEFNDIVWNSRTEKSFEDNWYEFMDEHNLHNNAWLSDLFDDRRMWVPIYFKGEFWAEQRELEDDAVDSRGVIPCATTSPMERQFQQEYTTCMFRDVQIKFFKKANCRVFVVAEEGPVVCMKVEKEKLVNDTILCVPYDVHFDRSTQEVHCECNLFESSGVLCCHCLEVFHSYKVYKVPNRYVLPCWSKNIKRKHIYVKSSHDVSRSDESHVAFRGLCAHFYNIAQDFVNDDEETTLLHAALEETRAKLTAHRAKKRSESV